MAFPPVGVSYIRQFAEEFGMQVLSNLYQFMTDLVNCYAPVAEDYSRDMALRDALSYIKSSQFPSTPAGVKSAFIAAFDTITFLGATPDVATNLPLPTLAIPIPPRPPGIHTQAVARVRQNRSRTTTANGRKMLAAAKGLEGWFHWVKSGPVPSNLPERYKQRVSPQVPFAPKASWSVSAKEGGGWETHDHMINDFARWMNGGPVPGTESQMNCWEAVFFTAYKAGLVTEQVLRGWHEAATAGAASSNNGTRYYDILNKSLGAQWAERMESEPGLIPKAGDIVYFNGGALNDHICLSLGRSWFSGEPVDNTYSLWHHHGGRFGEVTTYELKLAAGKDIFFAPCPF